MEKTEWPLLRQAIEKLSDRRYYQDIQPEILRNESTEEKMKPYYQDNHVTSYNKDSRDMSELADSSVQCVVTSPPYWGLRKYAGEQDLIWGDNHCEHQFDLTAPPRRKRSESDIKDQNSKQMTHTANAYNVADTSLCSLCGSWRGAYGLEPTPEMYVQHTIEILREIRRVLRKDGVVFWNIGDSYASKAGGYSNNGSRGKTSVISAKTQAAVIKGKRIARGSGRWGGGNMPAIGVLKEKDLCLIPFRVAIAAQADGWWVRSVIIWNKPNPMPESVKDRPTESHEYILMLTKSSRYYWDQEAVRERQTGNAHSRGEEKGNESYQAARGSYHGFKSPETILPAGRNLRSVWSFPTEPYPEAHFAVFPEKLPELCIKAATPEVGCCAKCGAPWERILEKGLTAHDGQTNSKSDPTDKLNGAPGRLAQLRQAARERGGEYVNETKTIGWHPTCKCNADKVPSIVLDPFAGAGTTLWVAKRLNRHAVGYDLAAEYCELGLDRNRQQVMV